MAKFGTLLRIGLGNAAASWCTTRSSVRLTVHPSHDGGFHDGAHAFSHTRACYFSFSLGLCLFAARTLTHIEITKSEEERGSNGSNSFRGTARLNSDLHR